MVFMGYHRPDGTVGIRNHVLVMPTVVCANRVARGIAGAATGSVWFEHQHGCTQLGADAQQTARVLISHGTHPNVFGVGARMHAPVFLPIQPWGTPAIG